MKVSPGVGGRGVAVSMERKEHPKSHFQMHRMEIEKASDGSYLMKHHVRLKAKHDKSENFYGGYKEPELHTAANADEMAAHVAKHFGAGKKKAAAEAEPDADDE